MSCINYWNNCPKCKKETYDRSRKFRCEKCGGEIESIKEWDEAGDYERETFNKRLGRGEHG